MAAAGRAHSADPAKTRAALAALADWLRDDRQPAPTRAELGDAARLTARTLADVAPGSSVEVRVPPFVAVQCIAGPAHRRGNPPNVVETDARTWLLLVTGLLDVDTAIASRALHLSGARAGEVAGCLPLVSLQ